MRKILKVGETGFFCDGAFDVLTSRSLGGSGLSGEEVSEILGGDDRKGMRDLLKREVCLPLFFDCDCSLDQSIVVVGDLTEAESQEWIGRVQGTLNIPCGKFILLGGGGDPDEFENAVSEEPEIDENYRYFLSIDVPPGRYRVEVLAYTSASVVDRHFEKKAAEVEEWFKSSRPGEALPPWIEALKAGDPTHEEELVSYIVHLEPYSGETIVPPLEKETGWCGEFEFRRPQPCPVGLPESEVVE